ncbi:MAG: DUF6544 family protein [Turicibacter sp.]
MFLFTLVIIVLAIVGYLLIPYSPVKNTYWKVVDQLTDNMNKDKRFIKAEDLSSLPEAIQKYFINNGYVGIECASAVKFDFKKVDFATGLNKPQLKIDYVAYDFVGRSARWALIDSKMFGIPFQGIDSYQDGKGAMKGVIAKHFELFNEQGHDMNLGALVTYLSECLMHPSLAIQECMSYKQLDEYIVEATIKDKGIEVSGVFNFNEKYEMTNFTAKRFASDTNSYENWSAVTANYKNINGINTPTKLQAIWHYPNRDLVYFDSNEMKISYH